MNVLLGSCILYKTMHHFIIYSLFISVEVFRILFELFKERRSTGISKVRLSSTLEQMYFCRVLCSSTEYSLEQIQLGHRPSVKKNLVFESAGLLNTIAQNVWQLGRAPSAAAVLVAVSEESTSNSC